METKSPSQIWWNDKHDAPEPPEPAPESQWKLSWNPLCGVMYGPIPIGLIIAIPIIIAMAS